MARKGRIRVIWTELVPKGLDTILELTLTEKGLERSVVGVGFMWSENSFSPMQAFVSREVWNEKHMLENHNG